MSHNDLLRQLFPFQLGSVFEADLSIEGARLDAVENAAVRLFIEMYADTADTALPDWERICGIIPASDATRSERVNEVLFRLRSLGRLDRQYFIDIAATIGFEITITELQPLMAGWAQAGIDEVMAEHVWWIWQVTIENGFTRYARAGSAAAGEPIVWFREKLHLDNIFNDLKPAHTLVVFI